MNSSSADPTPCLTGFWPTKSRLSCATVAFRHEDLDTALAYIQELGFAQVDVGAMPHYCPHLDFTGRERGARRVALARLRNSGLKVHSFTAGIGNPIVDETKARDTGLRTVEAAADLGVTGIVFNCGPWRDRGEFPLGTDLESLARVLREVAEVAANAGVRVWVEAPHKTNRLRTPEEALELWRQCDHPNIALVLDVNHHHAAGWHPADSVTLLGSAGPGLVHLRDAVGTRNRYPLGAGEVDWEALFRALAARSYAGMFSLEFTDAAPDAAGTCALLRQSIAFLETGGRLTVTSTLL